MLHYTRIADIEKDAKAAIDRWVEMNLSRDVAWCLERVTCNRCKRLSGIRHQLWCRDHAGCVSKKRRPRRTELRAAAW